MVTELKVGDILYSYQLREYTVTKIGNKYFECGGRDKFVIETLRCYSPNYSQHEFQLYKEKQFIIDDKEHESISKELHNFMGQWGRISLPLSKLRRILEIVKE